MIRIGIDAGSTTVKAVALDENGKIVFKKYSRHFSKINEKVTEMLTEIGGLYPDEVLFAMSGSAGMGLAESLGISFIQEVYATKVALSDIKGADVAIELGGEDAKILFLSGGMEVRMNGTCAGGTGAFIDQMAALLGVTADEINELSKKANKIYPIASRCGVFAKTDVQPLINQGAEKADLSRSILYAIVNQTVGGLAQGRAIEGGVVYLGGPLTFMSELRACFDDVLGVKGMFLEDSLYFVAKGAALMSDTPRVLSDVTAAIRARCGVKSFNTLSPLFKNNAEYEQFRARHAKGQVAKSDIATYCADNANKRAYLGVDSGSTTVKMVIIGEDGEILDHKYLSNKGNPVTHVRDYLTGIYMRYPELNLVGGVSTGYGEELIKNAFGLEAGIVETAAHFIAASHVMPNVEFVIDIGGQDMKCFKIKNGAIDDIFLNEACSSGCGSFLQTLADTMGYSIADFASMALFAREPVDLGSRCTVFMNSSIKQAQKDGASVENISAGLAVSVVKNALYKVIRVRDKSALGRHIVVQGGTFLSDAVLRAFEQELDVEVIRPDIAGLMGAYGAALKALEIGATKIISPQALSEFSCEVKNIRCGLCQNNCALTVNNFGAGRRYISGNKCERAVTGAVPDHGLNIFEYKLEQLKKYACPLPEEIRREAAATDSTNGIDAEQNSDGHQLSSRDLPHVSERDGKRSTYQPAVRPHKRGTLGLPFALNMYELLPFWHTFFTELGFECLVSPLSDYDTFKKGQKTIPSDTVCYPAKLVHGHIEALLAMGAESIFYPCLSYNFNERISNNHFNCPVVAYYPEVVGHSVDNAKKVNFITCYLDLNNRKIFRKTVLAELNKYYPDINAAEVKAAAQKAFDEDDRYINSLRAKGEEIIAKARAKGMGIIALVGRPYHADPEINHGIPRLIAAHNQAVISEDALPLKATATSVLNQWTYHARLYSAADYVAETKDINLVQLVSFGCGLDAVTTDEVRKHLEKRGKLYTQLKIDEITNLGAVKIRIKSLLAALENK